MTGSITAYFGPLISVAVGWFLHELSDTIKVRREFIGKDTECKAQEGEDISIIE